MEELAARIEKVCFKIFELWQSISAFSLKTIASYTVN